MLWFCEVLAATLLLAQVETFETDSFKEKLKRNLLILQQAKQQAKEKKPPNSEWHNIFSHISAARPTATVGLTMPITDAKCPPEICRECYRYGFETQSKSIEELQTKMRCQKIFQLKECCIPELIKLHMNKEVDGGPNFAEILERADKEDECIVMRDAKLGKFAKTNFDKIDPSPSFQKSLMKILDRNKQEFCEEKEKEHTYGYLLILLGFPMMIFGPLFCMGAASALGELCDKWELGSQDGDAERQRMRLHVDDELFLQVKTKKRPTPFSLGMKT